MALDLRDMLLRAGVGQATATLSIPYMMFMAGTTEPYAQGVQQLIKGLQRLLNEQGAHLHVDGGLGKDTVGELVKWAGPLWYQKTWMQLYQDVLSGRPWSGWKRESRIPGNIPMEGFDPFMDLITNPLVIVGAAAFAWWKWGR
jgi:hypothetical protein